MTTHPTITAHTTPSNVSSTGIMPSPTPRPDAALNAYIDGAHRRIRALAAELAAAHACIAKKDEALRNLRGWLNSYDGREISFLGMTVRIDGALALTPALGLTVENYKEGTT